VPQLAIATTPRLLVSRRHSVQPLVSVPREQIPSVALLVNLMMEVTHRVERITFFVTISIAVFADFDRKSLKLQ
jgi:hypothetical protein